MKLYRHIRKVIVVTPSHDCATMPLFVTYDVRKSHSNHNELSMKTNWWCSCGRGPLGWSRPGCRGRRWWGRCSRTCRRMGTWFRWCCRSPPSRRPSWWKPCSTPPVAPRPTPPSSCLRWAPSPRCSLGDMDLLEKGWRRIKNGHHLLKEKVGRFGKYIQLLSCWDDWYHFHICRINLKLGDSLA